MRALTKAYRVPNRRLEGSSIARLFTKGHLRAIHVHARQCHSIAPGIVREARGLTLCAMGPDTLEAASAGVPTLEARLSIAVGKCGCHRVCPDSDPDGPLGETEVHRKGTLHCAGELIGAFRPSRCPDQPNAFRTLSGLGSTRCASSSRQRDAERIVSDLTIRRLDFRMTGLECGRAAHQMCSPGRLGRGPHHYGLPACDPDSDSSPAGSRCDSLLLVRAPCV